MILNKIKAYTVEHLIKIIGIALGAGIVLCVDKTWEYLVDFKEGYVSTMKLFLAQLLSSFPILINDDSFSKTLVNLLFPVFIIWGSNLFINKRKVSWMKKASYDKIAIGNKYASSRLASINETNKDLWEADTISAIREIFREVAEDIEVVWMKPKEDGSTILKLYKCSDNVKDEKQSQYREFPSEDGIAGKVWKRAESDYYSPKNSNNSFIPKKGCVNKTYIAVPIDRKINNTFGILSVGSDNGFEPDNSDIKILELFASIILFYEQRNHS